MAKLERKLTELGIKGLVPTEYQFEVYDKDCAGLYVRVSPGGAKTFGLMIRVGGQQKRITLGRHPAKTLAEARKEAVDIRAAAKAGIDLVGEKAKAGLAKAKANELTFGRVADRFLKEYAEPRLRPTTTREYRRYLKKECVGLAEKPLMELTRDDIESVVYQMEARGAKKATHNMLLYLKKFLGWCEEKRLFNANPANKVRANHRPEAVNRFLSVSEIVAFWRAAARLGYPFGSVFQLLLLTGCRRDEIADMTWDEVEGLDGPNPQLVIPGSRSKNKREHIVPLSPLAVSVLQACPSLGRYIFTTTGATPVSGFSKAKNRLDGLMGAGLGESGKATMEPWTIHDLRRTFVTQLSEQLKVGPHIVEALVNHQSGTKASVAGIYNRATYLDERRSVLNDWANWIEKLNN